MIDRNQYDSYMKRARRESLRSEHNSVDKSIPLKEFEDPIALAQKENTPEIKPLEISMGSSMERWVFVGNVLVNSEVTAYEKIDKGWVKASRGHPFTIPEEVIIDEYKRFGHDEVRLDSAYDINGNLLPTSKAVYVRGERASRLLHILDEFGLNTTLK